MYSNRLQKNTGLIAKIAVIVFNPDCLVSPIAMIGAASVRVKSCVTQIANSAFKKVLHRAKKPDFGTMKETKTKNPKMCS
jgi:hypothetical protein